MHRYYIIVVIVDFLFFFSCFGSFTIISFDNKDCINQITALTDLQCVRCVCASSIVSPGNHGYTQILLSTYVYQWTCYEASSLVLLAKLASTAPTGWTGQSNYRLIRRVAITCSQGYDSQVVWVCSGAVPPWHSY